MNSSSKPGHDHSAMANGSVSVYVGITRNKNALAQTYENSIIPTYDTQVLIIISYRYSTSFCRMSDAADRRCAEAPELLTSRQDDIATVSCKAIFGWFAEVSTSYSVTRNLVWSPSPVAVTSKVKVTRCNCHWSLGCMTKLPKLP